MSNLLCIDFDFFFNQPFEAGRYDDPHLGLYDWGHNENQIMLSDVLWLTRASGFFQNALSLPGIEAPDGGWQAFWSRFTFADETLFEYADSNMYAGLVTPPDGSDCFDTVVLFDAHHDSGYRIESFADYQAQGTYSCEDWVLEHQRRGTTNLSVRYPQWKPRGLQEPLPDGALTTLSLDDGAPLTDTVFDTVFVCRSGAWVPPWCDQDFLAFVDSSPMQGEQVDEADLDRRFDPAPAQMMSEQMRTLIEQMAVPTPPSLD